MKSLIKFSIHNLPMIKFMNYDEISKKNSSLLRREEVYLYEGLDMFIVVLFLFNGYFINIYSFPSNRAYEHVKIWKFITHTLLC